MKMMKRMTETQAIMVSAIATQTPGSATNITMKEPTNQV